MSTCNFQIAVQFSLPSFANNLEQVANLLSVQATQPPTLHGMGNK